MSSRTYMNMRYLHFLRNLIPCTLVGGITVGRSRKYTLSPAFIEKAVNHSCTERDFDWLRAYQAGHMGIYFCPLTKHTLVSSRVFAVPEPLWQRSAFYFSVAAFSVFLLNFIFTVWATIARRSDEDNGVGTVFQAETCSRTKFLNTGIHVIINIFSTILLSGSNYCMQCLMAPTRSDIDRAHSKRRWLDIGVPSFRNFFSITWKKKILWLLLSSSSLPLHLLYVESIFAI